MKVSLAVQVLSDSTAQALRLAHSLEIAHFNDQNCLATAIFIEVCIERCLVQFCQLRSLKLPSGTALYSSRRYLSVLGFLVNIESLLGLVPEILQEQAFLCTYRLSQDHLELYFSSVRQQGEASSYD